MIVGLVMLLLFAGAIPAEAGSGRTKLAGTPRLHGREVPELLLLAPVAVGEKLPGGLPTTITFRMLPNRFVPVTEDGDGIYFEAVGRLSAAPGSWGGAGGLYLSKSRPDVVFAYLGNARHQYAPLSLVAPLSPADLKKLKTARPLRS
jgi:hypothetical protein